MSHYTVVVSSLIACCLFAASSELTPICSADWEPYELDQLARAKVTAYCPGSCCCGHFSDGRTAIGRLATLPGVAVDPNRIPYGSVVWVPGAGYLLADDTGGAMRASHRRGVLHIDLRLSTHAAAQEWGVRWLDVALYYPAFSTPTGIKPVPSALTPISPPAVTARQWAKRPEDQDNPTGLPR
jgi:3D (Asp-Asp-Asp) domain-containing protein